MGSDKKSVVIIGCGVLGSIIADGIKDKLGKFYEIAAVFDGQQSRAEKLAERLGVGVALSPEEIIAYKPAYVVEAASKEVVESMACDILKAGIDMIILSVGALADSGLMENIKQAGSESGAKLHVASGAIGGFDLMRAVRFGGLDEAEIQTTKNPHSLNGAPYLGGTDLPEHQEQLVFEGSSREAIEGFPKNVNVAVSMAVATLGVDETKVKINSCPGHKTNIHDIRLKGDFGEIEIKVAVKPSEGNAKSSTLAAWSVLALLEKMSQTIML